MDRGGGVQPVLIFRIAVMLNKPSKTPLQVTTSQVSVSTSLWMSLIKRGDCLLGRVKSRVSHLTMRRIVAHAQQVENTRKQGEGRLECPEPAYDPSNRKCQLASSRLIIRVGADDRAKRLGG